MVIVYVNIIICFISHIFLLIFIYIYIAAEDSETTINRIVYLENMKDSSGEYYYRLSRLGSSNQDINFI